MKNRTHHLLIDKMPIDVVQKNIKNVYLRIYPEDGRVQVSAPLSMGMDAVKAFVTSKQSWIQRKQRALLAQPCKVHAEYIDGEQHYFLGKPLLLKLVRHNGPSKVELENKTMLLYIRPNATMEKRRSALDKWYRAQLKQMIPLLIQKYERPMAVVVRDFGVKKMKTRWGSCNIRAKRIWLNLVLAKQPLECLEYVVVHEMAHLIERHHNKRFYSLMDEYLPKWKHYKQILNNVD